MSLKWKWIAISMYNFLCLFLDICLYVCAYLCPTLCDPLYCSLPGSSLHGIFQARILEWIAISSLGDLFNPRICISCISCIGRWILYPCTTWESQNSTDTLWHVKEPYGGQQPSVKYQLSGGEELWPPKGTLDFLIIDTSEGVQVPRKWGLPQRNVLIYTDF